MHSIVRNLRYSHIVSPVPGSCFTLCYNRGPVCNDRNHAGCITNPYESAHGRKIVEDTCGHWLQNPKGINFSFNKYPNVYLNLRYYFSAHVFDSR